MSIYHTTKTETLSASAEIDEHIKQFKRGGGKIQKIPFGISGESFEVYRNANGGLSWKDQNKQLIHQAKNRKGVIAK